MGFKRVEPTLFVADARVIDWPKIAANRPNEPIPVAQKLAQLGIPARTTHLRWSFNPGLSLFDGQLGMPTEPFTVWRRPAKEAFGIGPDIEHDLHPAGPGLTAITWEGLYTRVMIVADFDSGGTVMGVFGAPTLDNVVAMTSLLPGKLKAVAGSTPLTGLLISADNLRVFQLFGLLAEDHANRETWEQVERVGLPVDPAVWTGPVAGLAQQQGLLPGLSPPKAAAAERLWRAGLLYGWDRSLEAGQLAPEWLPPDRQALIAEVNDQLLPMLQTVVGNPPTTQFGNTVPFTVPPPTNSAGQPIPGSSSSTVQLSPLGLLLNAVSTDPHLAVALGFGTGLDAPPPPTEPETGKPLAGWDYMVSMRFEHGLLGEPDGRPLELGAIVCKPPDAGLSPGASAVAASHLGYLKPATLDGPWRASVRVQWQRLPRQGLLRVGSFAVVRRQETPPTAFPPVPLLEPRPSGGFRPIAGNAYRPGHPESLQLNVIDREVAIPPSAAFVNLKYYVAQQDIYGLWSHWSTTNRNEPQPPVDLVRILSVQLTATKPATGKVCPATLTVEFSWDWATRPPSQVRFVGRLFAAATHGSPPPNSSLPGGFDRSLGTAANPVDITFSTGGIPSGVADGSFPKPSILTVSEDGTAQVPPGPGQGLVRRYRATILGLQLDFSATNHIGIALWARGTERADASRVGGFGPKPIVVTASTPIPPVVVLDPVTLASLPDAAGTCHARIAWSPAPGAAGYYLYTASESAMRDLRNLGIAESTQTLAQRRKTLEDAFVAKPSRSEFTRVNASPLKVTSTDVTLPRGSSDIHAYVVLGVSGSGVESDWPAPSADQVAQKLIMVAAPRVAVPAAPLLEVRQAKQGNGFAASVAMRSRAGARVTRLDLHRVRVPDAAKELDTMGPPVATISASGGGWTATRDVHDQLLASGTDTPDGSWKRVYYRAVARGGEDLPRGIFGSRSPASPPVSLVLPPSTPPDLSAPTLPPVTVPPGTAGAADVLLRFTSSAPVATTPLGPHRLSVQVDLQTLPPATAPALLFSADLADVPTSAPVPGKSHVSRISEASQNPVQYAVLIRRASMNVGVSAILRLTDPLGRLTERLVSVPAGPDPDVSAVVLDKITEGVQLRWTTNVPITPIATGVYRVQVSAVPVPVGGKPGRPLVLDLPIDKVPPDGPLTGTDPLLVRRLPGGSAPRSFRAVCRNAITSITVRVTAPDGRVAEATKAVS